MLDFYFDFISPYAYLAWQHPHLGPRALAARHGIGLTLHPILFAGLLDHWGQLGPAEIPPKRAFLIKDVLRHAALASIPLTYPQVHPFNPLTLLRLALGDHGHTAAQQAAVIDALFALAWGRGEDVTSTTAITAALATAGIVDGAALLARTRDDDIKAALKRETEAAVARGVFGVPTFLVRTEAHDAPAAPDELFWGSDRAADVERFLAGDDPVDQQLAAAVIARPLGLARPSTRRA